MKQTFDSLRREKGPDSRERLLDAALELFGRRGFSDTSVRDLAAAARVNVGAVSYHFGSKECLRLEALRYGFAPVLPVAGKLRALLADDPLDGLPRAAEDALRTFVHVFLTEIVGKEGKHWALFMRERLAAGPALEMVMREFFAPVGKVLGEIIHRLLPEATEETIQFCVMSVIAQCVHVRASEPMVRFFTGKNVHSRRYLEHSAAHIAEFSVLAVRGMRRSESSVSRGTLKTAGR